MDRFYHYGRRLKARLLRPRDPRNSLFFRWRNSRVGLYPQAGAIFYAIPKNASSSAHLLLLRAEGLAAPEALRNPGFNVYERLQGLGPPYYIERRRIARRDKRRLCRFSFVRNPWERLLSCWTEKAARPDAELLDQVWSFYYPGVAFRDMDFADFARFVCALPERRMEAHFLPQCWFFNPSKMDFIGRVENFSRDIERLIPRLAPQAREKLGAMEAPRINPSAKQHYPDCYDERLRRLVGRRYARDIELFGYRFGA